MAYRTPVNSAMEKALRCWRPPDTHAVAYRIARRLADRRLTHKAIERIVKEVLGEPR